MPGHASAALAAYPELELHRRDEDRADDLGRVRGRVLPGQGGDVPVPPERARRGDGALPVEGDPHRRRRGAEGPLEGVPALPAAHEGRGPARRERAAELLHPADRRLRPEQGARDHRLGRDPRRRPAARHDGAGLARHRARPNERQARRARRGVAVEPHLHQHAPLPASRWRAYSSSIPCRMASQPTRRRASWAARRRCGPRGSTRRTSTRWRSRGWRRSPRRCGPVSRGRSPSSRRRLDAAHSARLRALGVTVRARGSRAGGADAGVRPGHLEGERADRASRRTARVPLHDRRHEPDGSIRRSTTAPRRSATSGIVQVPAVPREARRCSSRPR